jgi:hypothetical protein
MAADTRVSGASGGCYYSRKVLKIRGNLIGAAGVTQYTTKFIAWFRKEFPHDEELMGDDTGFEGLVLTPKGKLLMYSDCAEPDTIIGDFFAIGSGAAHAVTAMHLGKTPTEAVEIAKIFDHNTGGKVTEHVLKTASAEVQEDEDNEKDQA